MKRIVIQLNSGEHINIPADRMEVVDTELRAWKDGELVAYVDTGAVVSAHMNEKW